MSEIAYNLIPRDLEQLYSLLARLQPGESYLLSGERRLVWQLGQELADKVAIQGPLRLILGGNRYSVDRLPILLGDQAHRIYEVLNRIQLTRAETAYQMLHALETTPAENKPIFVTDFLDSFYEEALDLTEVTRLVRRCLGQMQRLNARAPLFISAALTTERPTLLAMLQAHCDYQLQLYPDDQPHIRQRQLL